MKLVRRNSEAPSLGWTVCVEYSACMDLRHSSRPVWLAFLVRAGAMRTSVKSRPTRSREGRDWRGAFRSKVRPGTLRSKARIHFDTYTHGTHANTLASPYQNNTCCASECATYAHNAVYICDFTFKTPLEASRLPTICSCACS